jgi:hypothetical protein
MESIARNELIVRLRREITRYRFHADAEIVYRSQSAWGRVADIGRGGMFIEVADPPPLGARFAVRIALNVPLELDCVVRRVIKGRGVGVTLSVGEKAKGRFKALLLALSAGEDPAVTGVITSKPKRPRTMAASAGR